ncbi:TetR/AcrR family transcriptional regulator [Polaromonas sp. UC242_47]|uniref:TetR/AcrR family transcriptional regulator n=1 Tax=Polaromonas sp. UC242_47 TaxID=3374626 RepID=UPI0037B2D300
MNQAFSQPPTAGARRQPTQQRSQERLDRILAAAKELIAGTGSDRVKMSEIAALADISIGSLYQYFPDKSAVVRTLAQRYNAESHRCIAEALASVNDLESLRIAYDSLVDQYYELLLAEPVMRDIWSGMQADKQLMALELEESRACGALLAAAMQRVSPGADAEKIAFSAFLIWQLGEATMRLAIALERAEGQALVAIYKRMSWREMAEP